MKKNVLFVSSEAVPFIKTGGLADVAGSLPKYFVGLLYTFVAAPEEGGVGVWGCGVTLKQKK